MEKYKVLSLFSGAGGMDLGFTHSGFEIVWANDFFKEAVDSYKGSLENFVPQGMGQSEQYALRCQREREKIFAHQCKCKSGTGNPRLEEHPVCTDIATKQKILGIHHIASG